ncbi:RES family NAD+ phosphorylase [Devosia rhodophyticola]|uniref:RES family NAD+ phosphorylase n=1 Tax=Devosia rhodophyticola TaxID=3026423 RepID=A0ABY7YX94_9HYPH|nr:RES family NAD+ phosphorylase [Devosia rhodophyticola]WDR05529.1 RES family NAD+ phosphorylase [Devosia rhodophyticola]
MVAPPRTRVRWPQYFRLINSAYPPIDLFEDIADPRDWNLLASAEAKTNPRIAESIGKLDLVPVARRAVGAGASYVMAPFTHCSPDKPGRFHTGHFGAFYGADSFETAVAETVFHAAKFFLATQEAPGWLSQMRELVGKLDAELVDICGGGFDAVLDADSYVASQAFARQVIAAGGNGILFPSVRQPGALCFAGFYPDVQGIPVQARHFSYHFDGHRVDMIKELTHEGDGPIYRLSE